jgi:hypothetical protein
MVTDLIGFNRIVSKLPSEPTEYREIPEMKKGGIIPMYPDGYREDGKLNSQIQEQIIYGEHPGDLSMKTRKIKRFNFNMPSQYLIDAYEQKKAEYLSHLTKDYSDEIDKIQNPQAKKIIPKDFEIEACASAYYGILYRFTKKRRCVELELKIDAPGIQSNPYVNLLGFIDREKYPGKYTRYANIVYQLDGDEGPITHEDEWFKVRLPHVSRGATLYLGALGGPEMRVWVRKGTGPSPAFACEEQGDDPIM